LNLEKDVYAVYTRVSSAAAPTAACGKSLAFAYARPNLIAQDNKLQVLTAAGKRQCHIEMDTRHDPANEELRG